jgi:hypothetical protein
MNDETANAPAASVNAVPTITGAALAERAAAVREEVS